MILIIVSALRIVRNRRILNLEKREPYDEIGMIWDWEPYDEIWDWEPYDEIWDWEPYDEI